MTAERVWYAAYGSNLFEKRFTYYRAGGNPPGTPRLYGGFRDPTPPARNRPLSLSGCVYFAGQSPVWSGGVAFYAHRPPPGWPAGAAARGYLLTVGQFSDLMAQEMHRQPGEGPDFDPSEVVLQGYVQLGDGRYETLWHVDDVDGIPVLTFTSPGSPLTADLTKPSARYLGMLAGGLGESHGWPPDRILHYLSELPGVRDYWEPEELRGVVDGLSL
ncbi:histone deacetylase [Nocardia nova]|uniref:Histone deacetylase n=1 Tax=Nocardia nova TaxID=37330 RepID=A0A2S6AE24_9NOCA|nr:histone deacetylase [Nocardia nova]PPJ19810.1 histone deacetylase [Nocardia nova]PPJ32336.1 histone deacetylase [Nocardia nova]